MAVTKTICWPEISPSSSALKAIGTRRGLLTYICPVYAAIYAANANNPHKGRNVTHWYWLFSCCCGGEAILSQSAKQGSCGCEPVKMSYTMPKESEAVRKFDRLAICNRKNYSCAHYRECQDERIEKNDISERYKAAPGSCYEAGAKEQVFFGMR